MAASAEYLPVCRVCLSRSPVNRLHAIGCDCKTAMIHSGCAAEWYGMKVRDKLRILTTGAPVDCSVQCEVCLKNIRADLERLSILHGISEWRRETFLQNSNDLEKEMILYNTFFVVASTWVMSLVFARGILHLLL